LVAIFLVLFSEYGHIFGLICLQISSFGACFVELFGSVLSQQ